MSPAILDALAAKKTRLSMNYKVKVRVLRHKTGYSSRRRGLNHVVKGDRDHEVYATRRDRSFSRGRLRWEQREREQPERLTADHDGYERRPDEPEHESGAEHAAGHAADHDGYDVAY